MAVSFEVGTGIFFSAAPTIKARLESNGKTVKLKQEKQRRGPRLLMQFLCIAERLTRQIWPRADRR